MNEENLTTDVSEFLKSELAPTFDIDTDLIIANDVMLIFNDTDLDILIDNSLVDEFTKQNGLCSMKNIYDGLRNVGKQHGLKFLHLDYLEHHYKISLCLKLNPAGSTVR